MTNTYFYYSIITMNMNMKRYSNVYFSEHTETLYVFVAAFADFRRLSLGLKFNTSEISVLLATNQCVYSVTS